MFIVINLFSKDFDKFWRLLEVDWFIVLLCVVVFIFSFFGLGWFLIKIFFDYGGNYYFLILLVDFFRNYVNFGDFFVIFVGN